MQQQAILYGAIGLLVGMVLTVIFVTNIVNSNNTGIMKMMGMHATKNSLNMAGQKENKNENEHMMPDGSMMKNGNMKDMTMDDMINDLKGKTGDDFDKAFISGMIEHHQGAIDMANLAKQYAGHDEIKSMADDIVSAQTNEINMMREWSKSWGY